MEEERGSRGLQYQMSLVRFSDADVASIDASVQSSTMSQKVLTEKMNARCESPMLPTLQFQQSLVEQVPPLPVHREDGGCQPWAKMLCSNRQDLRYVLLLLEEGEQNMASFFLFATQNPLRAYFAVARRVEPPLPWRDGASFAELHADEMHHRAFHFCLGEGRCLH